MELTYRYSDTSTSPSYGSVLFTTLLVGEKLIVRALLSSPVFALEENRYPDLLVGALRLRLYSKF
jgi:hypothetical protein